MEGLIWTVSLIGSCEQEVTFKGFGNKAAHFPPVRVQVDMKTTRATRTESHQLRGQSAFDTKNCYLEVEWLNTGLKAQKAKEGTLE